MSEIQPGDTVKHKTYGFTGRASWLLVNTPSHWKVILEDGDNIELCNGDKMRFTDYAPIITWRGPKHRFLATFEKVPIINYEI